MPIANTQKRIDALRNDPRVTTPIILEIAKGDNSSGRTSDRPYFSFRSVNGYESVLEKAVELWGEHPVSITGLRLYLPTDDIVNSWNMIEWAQSKSGKKHRNIVCDGETQRQWMENGELKSGSKPCASPACRCRPNLNLSFISEELCNLSGVYGAVRIFSSSVIDKSAWEKALVIIEKLSESVSSAVTFSLHREKQSVSYTDPSTQKRITRDVWAVKIKPEAIWSPGSSPALPAGEINYLPKPVEAILDTGEVTYEEDELKKVEITSNADLFDVLFDKPDRELSSHSMSMLYEKHKSWFISDEHQMKVFMQLNISKCKTYDEAASVLNNWKRTVSSWTRETDALQRMVKAGEPHHILNENDLFSALSKANRANIRSLDQFVGDKILAWVAMLYHGYAGNLEVAQNKPGVKINDLFKEYWLMIDNFLTTLNF